MKTGWVQRGTAIIVGLCAVLFVSIFVWFVAELRDSKPFKVDSHYEVIAAISLGVGALAAFGAWRWLSSLPTVRRLVLCVGSFLTSAWFFVTVSFALAGLLGDSRWHSDFGYLACLREWLKMSVLLAVAEAPVAAILLLFAARRQHDFHPSDGLRLGEKGSVLREK